MESDGVDMSQKTERARAELEETKSQLKNTQDMISRIQNEYKEAHQKYVKRTMALENLGTAQLVAIGKLNQNLEKIREAVFLRRQDMDGLEKINSELKEELLRVQEATATMTVENVKLSRNLNEQISKVDLDLVKTKEMMQLFEIVPDSFSDKQQIAFVWELLRQKVAREKLVQEQMTSVQKAIAEVENEIKVRSEELVRLKNINSNLNSRKMQKTEK